MKTFETKKRAASLPMLALCALAVGAVPGSLPAAAAGSHQNADERTNVPTPADQENAANASEEREEAQQLVLEATSVVGQMKQDQQVQDLLSQAEGVYVVPEFGRGAFVVGARGGAGVMTAQENGSWSSPAFYNFGAISVGAQAGASGGSIAFLLMSDQAVDAFKGGNQMSLNAEAGLSIIDYSANTQASWGKADVIVWSDTEGAYAGATVSVSDINWDDDSNRAFYGEPVELSQLLSGEVKDPTAQQLTQALPQ